MIFITKIDFSFKELMKLLEEMTITELVATLNELFSKNTIDFPREWTMVAYEKGSRIKITHTHPDENKLITYLDGHLPIIMAQKILWSWNTQ